MVTHCLKKPFKSEHVNCVYDMTKQNVHVQVQNTEINFTYNFL